MAEIIAQADLPADVVNAAGDRLDLMIAGANAKATRVAPCLAGTGDDAPTGEQMAEARLVLVGAISRWSQAGAGAYQQQTAGPFGVTMDTRQRTGYNLWPSEISDLQALCKNADDNAAYSVDTVADCPVHADTCSLAFGATYCSCGTDIAGEPIFGVG